MFFLSSMQAALLVMAVGFGAYLVALEVISRRLDPLVLGWVVVGAAALVPWLTERPLLGLVWCGVSLALARFRLGLGFGDFVQTVRGT
jgi:hypothetical protein